MKKEAYENQISKEALFFRVTVFIAVIIGIVQFFNILYGSIHDVPKESNNNNNSPDDIATETLTDSTKQVKSFIQPEINLIKPKDVYEIKPLKKDELIKPDTAQKR